MARIQRQIKVALVALAMVASSWRPFVTAQDVSSAVNETCYELPVLIITPTIGSFPGKNCKRDPMPSEDCMRRHTPVRMEVIDNNGSINSWNCIEGPRTSLYNASAHYRGQSSLHFSKHQYAVKLEREASFLNFPADREFVLNGPLIDGSLIRNHLAHALFRATGRWSPRTRHLVVFIRDTGTNMLKYQGIYLALEKITYGPHRVGLAQLDNQCHGASELSGGWAWQLNPLNYGVYSPNIIQDQYQLMFGSGERPVLMYPPASALTQRMRDYFVDVTTGPLPRLYRYLYDNITQADQLADYIDMGSFVDYLLHTELSQNSDGYRRSTYFFKDRDQPINAGPVWDFNLAYGLGANQEDWLFKPHFLWKRLLVNYKFVALLAKRWRGLRASVWSDEALQREIADVTAPLHRQLARCHGPHWYGKRPQCAWVKVEGVYADHVAKVERAVLGRAKWIDANIDKLYAKQDWKVWNPATNIPAYNCGPDANDNRCLTDPEPYIEMAEMPPLRTPQSDKQCSGTGPNETASIDPCWLSTGTNTQFCSGHGFCPEGPGAKCTCIDGMKPPTCAAPTVKPDAATMALGIVADRIEAPHSTAWWSMISPLLLVAGLVGVMAMVHRRRTLALHESERIPMLGMNQYGT